MTAAAADTAPDADLSVTLFGPLTVRIQGRPLPHLRSRKAQWLLALLVLRHGRPVEREWIAGTLWPDVSQTGAFANLRPVVSELRRALGGEAGRVLSPDRHTLSLDLSGPGVAVDLVAFDAAVASGTPADLERAVALYRGPLLEGVTEEWVAQDREAREQDCLRALFRLAGAAEGVRDHAAAARHWRQAVRLDPLSEVARRGLMTALAGEGDTNAALRVYREFVELLRGDPKATPDAETEALYARLRGAARRKAGSTRPPAAPAEEAGDDAPAVTGYLPHPLTELVGREDEREDAAAALRRSRLVTLTGPGGIGKTRLALEVAADLAADFPDGVWLVPLEGVATEAAVAPPVAAALGLREEPGRQPAPMAALTGHLRGKRLLLVLDNCEHVLAECAEVVARLLRECASVRVLATSREPLGVTGETVRAVPPLAVPPADLAQLPAGTATRVRVLAGYESVLLFVERAQAALKTFSLTGSNALAVARICERLDGIPLAIELAAARVRTLTVEQIAERLGENSLLLSGARARGAPPRHQTLRAALDWSYELLDDAERTLLRRLSVFSGGWPPEAAEAVCAGEAELGGEEGVREKTPSLVDKSLVQFDDGANEGAGRCRLLEMVRQYAAEKLAEEGVEEVLRVRRRHRQWLTELAEAAEPNLSGPDQEAWLRRLDAERANAAIALEPLEAGDEAARLRLAAALGWYWFLRGQYEAGRRHLERVMTECAGHPASTIRAKASNSAGVLAYFQADYAASQAFYEEALSLYRAQGDDRGAARALGNLANVAFTRGNNEEASAFYAETLALFEAQDDRAAVARTLSNMANLAQRRGDFAEEQEMNERALVLYRELEDAHSVASALYRLGKIARARGDSDTSHALLGESVAMSEKLGNPQAVAWALHSLGATAHSDGDHVSAERLYERAYDLFAQTGDQHGIACALHCLAEVFRLRGDAAGARERAEKALRLFEAIEDRFDVTSAHVVLADLAYDRGDLAEARAWCERALEVCGAVEDRWGTADALMRLGAVTLREGDAIQAAAIWGEAEALREQIRVVLFAGERERFDPLADAARSLLGEDTFSAAWAEGRGRRARPVSPG